MKINSTVMHTARARIALVAVALAAAAAFAGSAKANLGLPNGGNAGIQLSCEPGLATFNEIFTYNGPGTVYAWPEIYSAANRKWIFLGDNWTALTNGDTFTATGLPGLMGDSVYGEAYIWFGVWLNGTFHETGGWASMFDTDTQQQLGDNDWCDL